MELYETTHLDIKQTIDLVSEQEQKMYFTQTTMKRFYFMVLCLVSLISCSSPERVAEKALKDFGNGLFVEGVVGLSPEKLFMFINHKDIYSRSLIISNDVEEFLKTGTMKESDADNYFTTEIIFDNYKLMSKTEYASTLYSYSNYQDENEDIDRMMKEHRRRQPTYYKEIDDYFIFKNDNVPHYELRYKLDNRYLATVIVIKIPDVGYRVCAVWIH